MLDVAKGGGAQGQDGRADQGVGDDLDAEHICQARTTIIAEGPEDEVLPLLIEDEDSGNHICIGTGAVVAVTGHGSRSAAGIQQHVQ